MVRVTNICVTFLMSPLFLTRSLRHVPLFSVMQSVMLWSDTVKLNIPFLNRQRYVVLTAVTPLKNLCELAPVVQSSKVMPKFKDTGKNTSFRSCYGLIGSLKRSATIQSPTEFTVTSSSDSLSIYPAVEEEVFKIDYQHNNDAAYVPKDFWVTKLQLPYAYKCNIKGMHFAVCSHILNDTPMHILSGVVNFDHTVDGSLFNYVPKKEQEYFVPFKKPLAFIYPLSDLPLKVETIYDTQMFFEMKEENRFKPYYTNSLQKLLKNKNS